MLRTSNLLTLVGSGNGTLGDINDDKKVSIADITKLVNIILGKE